MNYINSDKEIFSNIAISGSVTDYYVCPKSGVVAWFSYAIPTGLTATIYGTPDDPMSLTARWVAVVTSAVGDNLTYKVSSTSFRGLKVTRNSGAGTVVVITASQSLNSENPLDNRSGLIAYHEADSGVTLDISNRVSQWNDLSGNNAHLVQATDASRPGFSATIFNGKPAVTLTNAVSSFMSSSPTFAGGTNPSTMIVVVRASSSAPALFNGILALGSGIAGGQTTCIGSDNGGRLWFGGAGFGLPTYNTVVSGSYYILAKTSKVVSGPFGLDTPFINGVRQTPYTQPAPYSISPANSLLLGRYNSGSNQGNWDVARVAVWNRELSDAEIYAQVNGAREKFSLSI